MTWVDLSIICLFIWGGVAGYITGWKRTIYRVAAILFAVFFAVTFKVNMIVVMEEHYPVEQAVKEIVDGRLVLPVDASPAAYPLLQGKLGIPRVLYETLLDQGHPHAPVDFMTMGDRLTRFLTELIAFSALFFLWWAVLSLFIWIYAAGKGMAGKSAAGIRSLVGRCGGAIIGASTQMLLAALLLGAIAPIIWVSGLDSNLALLEEGVLARLGMQLFQWLHLP